MVERYMLGTLDGKPEIATLLGTFIARWSLAETTLIMPLLVALGSPNQEVAAAILASTNSTEGKIKLVQKAIDTMQSNHHLQKPMKAAIKKLASICEERNSLCHHAWAIDVNADTAVTVDFRTDKLADRISERSPDYLRDLCNRTIEAAYLICDSAGSTWVTKESIEKYRV